jgi:CRP-like cAMP-binding protein
MEAFPLHQFLRTNFDSESHMERVEQILEAPTSLRTEDDCNFLVDCLSSIDFFKKTSRALCFEIARVAWFLSLEKNETGMILYFSLHTSVNHENPSLIVAVSVFKQGELGTKFYVILKGSVSVRVQDMLKPDDKGYEAAVLIAGKSFGELALHSDNSVRSATIVAIEDCGFLTVDRVDYDRILKKALDGEAQEKFEFCSDLPFLSDCSTRELQRLSAIMTKKKFDRDTMIFAQGDDSNNLYFVLSGEVRIVHYLEIKYATAEQIEAQRTARLNRLTHSLHAATSDEYACLTSEPFESCFLFCFFSGLE